MKKLKPKKIPISESNIFKWILLGLFVLMIHQNVTAQLYINGDVLVQSGETLFATDSITLGTNQSLVVNGTVHSTKGINTNGNYIKTLNGGSIISPVPSGVAKSFDIGTIANNRIQILQNSGSAVSYRLNVNDLIHINPQTKATPINTNVVNKTWLVQPLTASNNTSISLFWNAADELSGFNRTNCAISRWEQNTTSSWSFTTATATSQTTGSSPAFSRTISTGNLVTSVYYFGIGGSGSSLPVTLLDFNAKNQNDDVKLEWATSSEINNSHFEIERSNNKSNWHQIAILKGAGNSNIQNNYEFIDPNPYQLLQTDKIFYRLKQVDFDENYNYSNVKVVSKDEIHAKTEVSLFPNPANEVIYLHLLNPTSITYHIELTDIYGKKIRTIQLKDIASSIDLFDLSSGIYFIKVIDTQTQTIISTNKIFKN